MSGSMRLAVHGDTAFVYTGGRAHRPGQPAVVFVHGAAMDHSVWVLPARYFARHGYNVLAVDLPGHGRSGGQPPSSVEDMANWVVAVLDAAGVASASLVGHSLGSLVTFDLARRHRQRVDALALVGSALPMAVSDVLLDAARDNRREAIDMLTYWGYSRAAWRGGSQSPGMWMTAGTQRLLERAAPGVLHTDLAACNAYLPAAIEAVDVPCALILGDRDVMTPPRASAALASHLPGSRTVVLGGAGHTLMAERPEALLDALIGVIDSAPR